LKITNYTNILIIKPSALGDVALALPVISTLRASFPNARISWLVRAEFAPLLRCAQGLDEIIIFDRKFLGRWYANPAAFKALRGFLKTLRSRKFDLVLDLQGLLRTAFFSLRTGCKDRLGMSIARECATLFYTNRVSPPDDSNHLIDYYNKIAAAAGAVKFSTAAALATLQSAVKSVSEKLAALGLAGGKYAVLVPGSAQDYKCWPGERFANIAERLTKEKGLAVVAVGTASEKPIIDRLVKNARTPILSLAGKTDIPELVALLKGASLVLSNDTGPGHIAAVLNSPTVIVFGPTNPSRVGPYGKPDAFAAIEPEKRGRAVESKNPAHSIMNVPAELVWEKITAVLNAREKPPL